MMETPTIRTRSDANLRPARWIVNQPIADLSVISIHHTAGSTTYPWRDIQWEAMQSEAYSDAHYNWGIDDATGYLQTLRGDDVRPQADGVNWDCCAIVLRGNYMTRLPSAAALETLAWKIAERARATNRLRIVAGNPPSSRRADTLYVVHHRERMSTACPGDKVVDYRPTLIARVRAIIQEDDMPTADEIASAVWTQKNSVLDRTYGQMARFMFNAVRPDYQQTPGAVLGFRRDLARLEELSEAVLAATSGQGHADIMAKLDANHAERMAALAELEARLDPEALGPALAPYLGDMPAEQVTTALKKVLRERDLRAADSGDTVEVT
jgi:hypothetical protein